MSESGDYHHDTFESERSWHRDLGNSLLAVSTVLIVVGIIGAVGWLWVAARSQGLLGGDWPSGLSAGNRVDFVVGTLDQLVLAVFGITVGIALRRHAEGQTT